MIYDCLISDIVNRGHIDTGHGHKLERIIIYLIMIEVFFECLHFYERYFNVLLSRHNSPNISSPENMEDSQFWNPETQVTLKKWLNSLPKERLLLPRKRRKKESSSFLIKEEKRSASSFLVVLHLSSTHGQDLYCSVLQSSSLMHFHFSLLAIISVKKGIICPI